MAFQAEEKEAEESLGGKLGRMSHGGRRNGLGRTHRERQH